MMLLTPRSAQQVALAKIGLFISIGFLFIFIRACGVCDDLDDVGIHDRQCCLPRSAQQVALAFIFICFLFILIYIIFMNIYIN